MPDDGSYEQKCTAHCRMAVKCCAWGITIQQFESTNEWYREIKSNKLLQLPFSLQNLFYCINITFAGVFGSSTADRKF